MRFDLARFDLTDFEWLVIEPLLPMKVLGMKRRDDWPHLNGISWRLRISAPRAGFPVCYSLHATCVNRL